MPEGVTPLVATNPVHLVPHAPENAHHLIMTFSHGLDLDLCHALLGRTAGFIGLIGSQTKWVRFSKRLAALGHSRADINRITCPIGDPGLGKHPQEIAIGVAGSLIRAGQRQITGEEIAS
jgi:xanthine dehydrogenase accessory factor